MDVEIYRQPNPALTEVLISTRMRGIVLEVAELAQALYREEVTKRTGRLALSAHASTEKGGAKSDRWIGVLTVGGLAGVDYAASHEFGADIELNGEVVGEWDGAHDLNRVLEILSIASYM